MVVVAVRVSIAEALLGSNGMHRAPVGISGPTNPRSHEDHMVSLGRISQQEPSSLFHPFQRGTSHIFMA